MFQYMYTQGVAKMYTVDRTTALHKHTISIILTLTRCLNSRLNVIMTYADLTICFSERPKLSVHLNHRQTYCVQKIWMYRPNVHKHANASSIYRDHIMTEWHARVETNRIDKSRGNASDGSCKYNICSNSQSFPRCLIGFKWLMRMRARVVRRTAGSFICGPYLLVWQLSRSLLCQKFKSRST